ncbi:MAG: peptidylprolyl isomerase [Clostridia bacterium]|nr:peptidylprolyl isomerase [Clostridia bacterium]MDD4387143.1 peptidylprolyl isomerase [Clostridia bacterium]
MDKKEESLKEVKGTKKFKIAISNDKKIIISIVAIVMIVAFGIFGWFYYNNNLKPVVKFDGGSLTTSEFTIYYKTFAPMLEYYGYEASTIPTQIANKAAADKIILLKAKEAGVTLSDEDKAKVDEIFNDETQIKKFTDDGIDPIKMKQLYYNDYIITAYISKLKGELTNEEVTTYLKTTYGEDLDMTEFVTRHILFSTIDSSTGSAMTDEKKAEVKVKAEAALVRVLAGEDFEALVKELSEDTGTKEKGGLYKMYLDENTMEQYRNAVKSLSIGSTTTALVETSAGYHIIKLDSKNENGRVNSDSDREAIASTKIDEITKTMNIVIVDKVITKVVENITGVKATAPTTETTTPTTDTTTPTTDTTTPTTDTTTPVQ